ncbi:phosphonate ABC transporter ATP-binding protein [Roseovarius sp. LXJ103]|uniref:phosphonate ABC transporter ATP-binding protein n=1 Tax=Roseovarius carneus TaxID=2853164 RepID=UPI000D611C5F|nr:phosphonate ABC transporter ATP-binding protein [Roseovarius carneus]MBZ8117385.1 phosphonate ABC transporter ATP-binding protein [Roseovarius carneus]PWE36798.1 phosphonate ABC transporter ATP-binding protein [Pelagicola sp. LXJ1103]
MDGSTRVVGRDILSVDNVEVVYPNGTRALNRTACQFADGEVTVLLGPSGAGKSTLLRTLNLLTRPSAGYIVTSAGQQLKSRHDIRSHRRDTAMIFQQHQLIGRLSALRNVLMARLGRHEVWTSLVGFSRAEKLLALESLSRVGLFDKALTRCDSLSGGQQQRVGIARALTQEPKLILADEPIASLDPASSDRVMKILRDVCREDRIPVIVSLHQLDFAKAYADRIIGLSDGDIVFDGPPSALDGAALARIYGAPTDTTT